MSRPIRYRFKRHSVEFVAGPLGAVFLAAQRTGVTTMFSATERGVMQIPRQSAATVLDELHRTGQRTEMVEDPLW